LNTPTQLLSHGVQMVYHNKFSTQSHPNIFEIVKKEQACTEMKMKQF